MKFQYYLACQGVQPHFSSLRATRHCSNIPIRSRENRYVGIWAKFDFNTTNFSMSCMFYILYYYSNCPVEPIAQGIKHECPTMNYLHHLQSCITCANASGSGLGGLGLVKGFWVWYVAVRFSMSFISECVAQGDLSRQWDQLRSASSERSQGSCVSLLDWWLAWGDYAFFCSVDYLQTYIFFNM